MKIVFAGAWQYDMYEAAFAQALERLGIDVIPCSLAPKNNRLLSRFEFKYTFMGPHLRQIQEDLLAEIDKSHPDLVLIWLGASIFPETLQAIKQRGNITLVSYVHDDPFAHRFHQLSPKHHRWYWRVFIQGLPYYDITLFSKQLNVDEAYRFGAKRSAVLGQYFVPSIHQPYTLTVEEKYRFDCDVVFAGHFEPDGRERCLRALVKTGIHVRLFGGSYWTRTVLGDLADYFGQVRAVYNEEYAKALCGAKICLCFLSKMNRDSYTTRCFEIPACGRLLLCERTEDLKSMFKEGEEAVFFSSKEELVEKSLWLLNHPEIIDSIAEKGRKRVWADEHDVVSRAKQFVEIMNFPLNREAK